MKDRLLHTPEGVRDIYNSECARKLLMDARLHQVCRLYGYEDIQTPMFEFFEIFSEERGTVPAKDMYKFFDREGNTLVLRPDMTPSIARCAAKYFGDSKESLRLCYSGNTFLNNSEYQGKLKESTQLGAELIGDASAEADAEILALTVECLLASGLTEFQVEVGQVEFFKALVAEAGFDPEETEQLRNLIVNKNLFGMEDFLSDKKLNDEQKEVLTKLPELFGSIERLGEFKKLTKNERALASIERLEKIFELMKLYGYEKYISFDLGMLSQYSYYTGIIFNAYTYGMGDSVMSGGRYDNLVGQFGKDAAAVGMAIKLDNLMTALYRSNLQPELPEDRIVLKCEPEKYAENVKLAQKLRAQGTNVAIELI